MVKNKTARPSECVILFLSAAEDHAHCQVTILHTKDQSGSKKSSFTVLYNDITNI